MALIDRYAIQQNGYTIRQEKCIKESSVKIYSSQTIENTPLIEGIKSVISNVTKQINSAFNVRASYSGVDDNKEWLLEFGWDIAGQRAEYSQKVLVEEILSYRYNIGFQCLAMKIILEIGKTWENELELISSKKVEPSNFVYSDFSN